MFWSGDSRSASKPHAFIHRAVNRPGFPRLSSMDVLAWCRLCRPGSGRVMAIRRCWRRLLAVPGSWCLDQDERGIVAEWRAGMAQQIGTHAFKQVWADAVGAGRGQLVRRPARG